MAKKINNRYYVKNSQSGSYSDVTVLFDGVSVLAVEGLNSKGKSLNVYSEQWVTGGTDFLITSDDGKIVRENVDIKVVFICGQRYSDKPIDTQSVYDTFVEYMTSTDVWIASRYVGKQVHCVNIDGFEPNKVKLKRGGNSYILGEITMKTLEKPTSFE